MAAHITALGCRRVHEVLDDLVDAEARRSLARRIILECRQELRALTKAPASAVRFVGNGANIVYIDWDNDLVVVVRWIKDEATLNEFLGRVIGALGAPK